MKHGAFFRIFTRNFWKFRFYSYLCSPQKQPLAVREWIFGDVAIKIRKEIWIYLRL